MLIPILAITTALFSAWFLTSVLKVWDPAAKAKDNRFAFPDQGISLGSFILLLFSCSSSVPASPFSSSPKGSDLVPD